MYICIFIYSLFYAYAFYINAFFSEPFESMFETLCSFILRYFGVYFLNKDSFFHSAFLSFSVPYVSHL